LITTNMQVTVDRGIPTVTVPTVQAVGHALAGAGRVQTASARNFPLDFV